MEGHLIRYNKTYFKNTIETFGKHPEEGPVTQVVYQFGMLVWSTPKKIRVIHYNRNRQKICMVLKPDDIPSSLEHMSNSNLVFPKILLKQNLEKKSRIADPNVDMYIAWFNEIKKVQFEYKPKIDKFEAETSYKYSTGNIFIVGMNISMLKDRFITCEFDHELDQQETS